MAEDALFASFAPKAPASVPTVAAGPTPTPKKRGASPPAPAQQTESAKKAKLDGEGAAAGPSGAGEANAPEAKFAVADDFETEAKTTVPSAGEAENLILSHQVSFLALK